MVLGQGISHPHRHQIDTGVLVRRENLSTDHTAHPETFADWLRDKVYFEKLLKRDSYAKARLGFTAPNIFVMVLVS